MKKTTKIIMVSVLVAIILLGIGYAAIQNITLNISGTAVADPNQENFKVMFAGIPTVSDSTLATASIQNNTTAKFDATLSKMNDSVSATYTIENSSIDLWADLIIETTNSNDEYFEVTSNIENNFLEPGESTTVVVSVKLIKVAIEDDVTTTIGIGLNAEPIQMGEGNASLLPDGPTQSPPIQNEEIIMTLGVLTNDNIGDYIDLGNNIIGTENTTDDWRVLYIEGDTVYVILADYLPAEQVSETTGFEKELENYPYSVWIDTNRNVLVTELKRTSNWAQFTNGIPGATATGAPTPSLLMDSYNTKNDTWLYYNDYPMLNGNLYSLSNKVEEKCSGYWLAGIVDGEYDNFVWHVDSYGQVSYISMDSNRIAARPVVSLPITTEAVFENGILKISK